MDNKEYIKRMGLNMTKPFENIFNVVNTCYLVVSAKGNVYDMSSRYDLAEEDLRMYNNMTSIYGNEQPFRIVEVEPDTVLATVF